MPMDRFRVLTREHWPPPFRRKHVQENLPPSTVSTQVQPCSLKKRYSECALASAACFTRATYKCLTNFHRFMFTKNNRVCWQLPVCAVMVELSFDKMLNKRSYATKNSQNLQLDAFIVEYQLITFNILHLVL